MRGRTILRWLLVVALASVGAIRPVVAQEGELSACGPDSGAPLDGVVVDRNTGVPLVGASVTAGSPGMTRTTSTTSQGRFRFCEIPEDAPVLLGVSASGLDGDSRRVVGSNGGEPVILRVDLGTPAPIAVMVTDADTGEPVEGVTVRLEPGIISGVTGEGGRAGLGQVPPGDYTLRADHLAYAPFSGDVFVISAEPRTLSIEVQPRPIMLDTLNVSIVGGQCAAEGFTSVSGKVVDRRTKIPLSGAIVSASRYDGEEGFIGQRTQVDDDGEFSICGMPIDSRVRLQATLGPRSSDARFLDAERSGEAIVLEIDHGEPGFVALFVTDAGTGRPVEGAMIRLKPLPLAAITDERGRAGIREAPPGDYDVRVEHFAYASFEGTLTVGDEAAEEWEIPLSATAISVEPLEVKITGRDPYLLGLGFYDRMMDEKVDGMFYDYWDFESYATLGTFTVFKTFIRPDIVIPFVNGRPADRTGYESLNEIPFGKIRGVEFIRCVDLPPEMARWLDDFEIQAARQNAGYWDCVAQLIWRGERRVRSEREPPTDRCARERRAELVCRAIENGVRGSRR